LFRPRACRLTPPDVALELSGRPARLHRPPAPHSYAFVFFFNGPAPPELYTLSLHDALPIFRSCAGCGSSSTRFSDRSGGCCPPRSEEHTSELQSRGHLVCRLLLEKKKRPLSQDHGPPPAPRPGDSGLRSRAATLLPPGRPAA